jgi:NodT family efflux transporter outer membrane factor (OMF) lipoprotein
MSAAPVAVSAQEIGRATPAGVASIWTRVGDTTLDRLIADALRGNQDLRVATARLNQARAARLRTALDLAPAVTAAGGYSRQRFATAAFPGATGSLPDQDLWDVGLRLAWDVDVFGATRRSLRGQRELVGAASEDLRTVQAQLVAEVADTYFALRSAQARLAVAERSVTNLRGTLDLTVQRLEGGSGTALDSERARALLSTTLADVPTLEAVIAAARYQLGVLTARSASESLPPLAADSLPSLAAIDLASLDVESVVHGRPDVRSAERQLAAQSAFVSAARAGYLPRLSIGGGVGYTGARAALLGTEGTARYSIGPSVTWPAFDIGRVRASVDAARAGEVGAQARHEQTVLRAHAEIESAVIAYQRSHERLGHLDAAAAASERAAELARLRFAEGASDFLPVLDAERTLLDAQHRRVLGRAEAIAALVALDRALLGAWPGG